MFEPIEIKYLDKTLQLPANNFLPVAATVEESITYSELAEIITSAGKNTKYAKLSIAYSALLKSMGEVVDDQEVLHSIFDGTNTANAIDAMMNVFNQFNPPQKKTTSKKKQPKTSK